jgi:hypothetical protein
MLRADEFLLEAIAAVAVASEHIIAGQQSWVLASQPQAGA